MSRHNCPGEECASCSRRIADIEDARSGVDFDPSGRMGDRAADRWEDGRG
ncbi:MAG TPA: hypothetical protein VJL80_09905 [Aeromicrobium sp.]|nr:hypothetical protein [Aeromicrobium sp.]HKY58340.1 hypothetical protein [Aeromicrobium sp.]